ncbi:MAG: phycobiliprotein lyase [Cyanobacteria bacterium P01_H01_bin.130]
MDLATFQRFFDNCVGEWISERTYHYLTHQEVERSQTEFQIRGLDEGMKRKVLSDNDFPEPADLGTLPGYHLDIQTVSEHGDTKAYGLNFLFVPDCKAGGLLTGSYLRDRAYEESKPMVAQFQFNPETNELALTTTYTRVISVDSITLVNPVMRVRKILNYHRPPEGEALSQIALAGFGIEQKK